MKKGNLSSVTLAVSLVFGSNTIAANPCIEKSTEFKESKNYSVDYANTVRSKRADQLVRIKIDPEETLTLQNTNNRSKSSVVKSETEAGIAFSGGNLILMIQQITATATSITDTSYVFLRALCLASIHRGL